MAHREGPELVFEETTSNVRDRRVALIQRWLHDRNGFRPTIDGLFGPKTKAAVQAFQRTVKITDTGIVDKATGRAMGLPFWEASVSRRLDPPFRDSNVFDKDHEFKFRSELGTGYFFSSSPDAVRDTKNCLTARALRTNNPGAINISRWQKELKGYVGRTNADSSGNKTTIYDTPESGVAAWGVLLRVVYFKNQKDKVTVGEIIDKYRGGIPRQPYLAGYLRFSDGKLLENFLVDLYDNSVLMKVAVASFSHEFGSWYPLADEQILAGLAISDVHIGPAMQAHLSIVGQELDPSFYGPAPEEASTAATDLDDGAEQLEEGIDSFGSITSLRSVELASAAPRWPRLDVSDARWPNDPADAPDTWHLPPEMAGADFELTYDLVTRLVELGCFQPDFSTNGKFILSLRGCVIKDGSAAKEDRTSVQFTSTKPDHEHFLCSIGVVDTANRLLSFYKASTVPRRTGMLRFYNKIHFGTRGANCNILPSGCYEHCVGTHHGHAGAVPFVLRLGNGPEPAQAGEVLVLRTTNDLIYGTQDMWDRTKPGDNIHPAFLAVSFSSVGCLTLHGTQVPGRAHTTATREWKAFRDKAGFDGENRGKRFDNVLVTGHEVAAVAAAVAARAPTDTLVCLRQGSRGERVGHLQEQLGVQVDGNLGPETAEQLVARQREVLGYATGTWTQAMADLLKLKF